MPRFVFFNCFPILDPQALHLQSYDFSWGYGGLRYRDFELFFKRYFGNHDFDFNVQYCNVNKKKNKKILPGIAVPFIWPLLSNVGQYVEDIRLNGKWIHNFRRLLYDEISRTSNNLAFWWLYRSTCDLTFTREGWGWFLVYTDAWYKKIREMDTTLSKRDRS